jgi:geranylgeranyl diphosphate synthase type I
VWGEAQAINAGDATFTLAYLALLRLKEKGIADDDVATAIEMLSLACLDLCEGQYLDVDFENRLDITIEDYLDMAARKTAALFAAAASLGAYLGGRDHKVTVSFHRFGRELGIAYQIRDDMLGIWEAEESVGKSAGDIARRKKTLPVVYALHNADGEAKKNLGKLYSQRSIEGDDIRHVIKILERSGAREHAEDLAGKHYRKALAHLEATGLDASTQAPLKEMASFLVNRDF